MTDLDPRWHWTATSSALLAGVAPLVAYFGMWGVIGIGHGSSRGARAVFWGGLAVGLCAAVLGVMGLRSPRWRGRWLSILGVGVGLLALVAIAAVLVDDGSRRQYVPFLR